MSIPLRFEGVWPILPTPFHEDESLDLDSLARVVRFMAEAGMDGVTVLGVMGEANRVGDGEREAVIRAAVEAAAGRLPVIAGATHPGTAATLALCAMARSAGAAGVMISPSAEPTPSEERVAEYFRRVGEGAGLPIVLQDHPPSSGVFMGVPLLLRLAAEVPAIACIKLEHPPTPQKVAALRRGWAGSAQRPLPLLQGLGALYAQFDLERGAAGFMTGFAFPEVLRAMVNAARAGDPAAGRALFARFLPLIVYEQQPALAVRKEIYRLRGLLKCARVRHPGGQIDPETAAELRGVIAQVLPGVELTRPLEWD